MNAKEYSLKQEILKKRGITPATQHHDYNYLYKSVITAMEEYHQLKSEEEAEERLGKAVEHMKNKKTGGASAEVWVLVSEALRIASGKGEL